jgi:ribosomal protein L29
MECSLRRCSNCALRDKTPPSTLAVAHYKSMNASLVISNSGDKILWHSSVCGLSTCIESVASVQGYRAELVIWKLSANERKSPNVNTFSKIQREIAKERQFEGMVLVNKMLSPYVRPNKNKFVRLRAIADYKRLIVNSPLNFAVCVQRCECRSQEKDCPNMSERSVGKLNFSRRLVLLAAGSMIVAVPSMLGQTSTAPSVTAQPDVTADVKVPAFDVVSVKPNKSDSGMVRVMGKPDGYAASNVSLKMLIQSAYGIREDLVSGAPSWADSARFDIDAKVAGSDVDALKKLSPEQRRSILRPLLADRFKLKIHTETKQLPVYEIVLAKRAPK